MDSSILSLIHRYNGEMICQGAEAVCSILFFFFFLIFTQTFERSSLKVLYIIRMLSLSTDYQRNIDILLWMKKLIIRGLKMNQR